MTKVPEEANVVAPTVRPVEAELADHSGDEKRGCVQFSLSNKHDYSLCI
ncbi:hypothetical protein LC653_40570 [Nostoc sp. CHAB 5784]|nr:hypothetical protein [Nostoc mirabile]MCC5669936.1 hypothetical protein [Nostoc mirabile CHAB5784]